MPEIDRLIDELRASIAAGQTAVFCGAGISLASGLPSARDLVTEIMRRMGASEEDLRLVISSGLPFEAFIETFTRTTDVNRLFKLFEAGQPTKAHLLFAALARRGLLHVICTTNFDLLVERATTGASRCEPDDRGMLAHYKETTFDDIDWHDGNAHLIKLHGSAEDAEHMGITLRQVASRTLSAHRRRVIERLFQTGPHTSVLVVGYSCSDVFDISPQIVSLGGTGMRVLYVDHDPTRREVRDLKEKTSRNPFLHLSGKWALCDTDVVLDALWDTFCANDQHYSGATEQGLWVSDVGDWCRMSEESGSAGMWQSLLGSLFFKVSDYHRALEYHTRALAAADSARSEHAQALSLSNCGKAHLYLGNRDAAVRDLEAALVSARRLGDKAIEADALNTLGSVDMRTARYSEALEHFQRALELARALGDTVNMGGLTGNIGSVHRLLCNYPEALAYHRESVEIARDVGDKQKEGNGLGNIGNVLLCRGQYTEAEEQYRLALDIAEQIGDKQKAGLWLGNLGTVCYERKDFERAIDYFEQSLHVAIQVGDRKKEAMELANIAGVRSELKDYRATHEYCDRALAIAVELCDKEVECLARGARGAALAGVGDHAGAALCFEQALQIAQATGDRRDVGIWRADLGEAYRNLGRRADALAQYQAALAMFRELFGEDHPYLDLVKKSMAEMEATPPPPDP